MAEPIIVEGPDGQEYEFPAGTSPETMKQAMQKRYGVKSSSVPAANQNILPGMGAGQMGVPGRVGYGGATGAQSTAPSISQLQSFNTGTETGASFGFRDEAEGVRATVGAPRLIGPLGPLTDIATGAFGAGMEAFGVRPEAYTAARDVRRTQEAQAREANPVSFMAGEVAGSIAVPVGTSATAATKTGQVLKGAGAGALASGAYGFGAADGDIQERAKQGAIYGVTGAAMGGALSAVIPRNIPLGQVLNAELFGTKVDRPVLKTIERMLVDAGVAPNDIATGVVQIRQRLQSGDVGAGLPTRFKDELVKQFGDKARGVATAIENQIRGGAVRSGSASDAAVRAMVREDNAAARELFDRSLDQFAGSISRPELRGQALDQLQTIVEDRYKPILAAGIADPAKQQRLMDVLAQPRMQSLAAELAEDAEREGIDLAVLIARNPAEAAHWMQSKARQLANDRGKITITGRVVPDRLMSNRRDDILKALEDAVPGYRETRMEYGDKFGVLEAVDFARGFLSRAKDDIAVADMAEEFGNMSKAQQDMALASVRSLLSGSAGNVRYVDPDLGPAALRTAEIGKEPVLKALSDVFGEPGTALADDIKAIVTRFDENRRINPQGTGSDTMPKAEALKFAMRNTRGPIQRTLSNVFGGAPMDMLGSAFAGVPTPISAARVGIEGLGRAADRRAMSTVDKVTELLLSRPQNAFARTTPESLPPAGGGTGGSIIEQLPQSSSQTVPSQNAFRMGAPDLRTDSMNALAFGTVGGLAPADSTEDRIRNATVGAALGVGAGRAQRAWAAKQPLVLGPRDEVLTLTNELPASDLLKAQRPAEADNLKRLGEIQTLLDARRKALAQQPVERGATDDEWTEAIGEAKRRINAVYRGGVHPDDIGLSSRGDDAIRVTVAEDLADVILRENGLDPGGAKSRWIASRGTNKKAAETRARRAAEDAQRQAKRDAMDEIDIAVMEFEDYNPDFSLSEFAKIATREIGSNMPASEMTARDVFELAQRLARQFDEKGGQGATKAEMAAKQFVTWVDENVVGGLSGNRGNPTRTSGLASGNAFAQSVMGGAGGSAYGSQNDINGDGVIDEQDVFLGSAAGTVGVPVAMGVAGRVGNAFAKNVDPSALKAAKAEGFNTSRIMYRGMTRPVGEEGFYATVTPGYEAQGLGVSLSTSRKKAGEYGEYVYPIVVRGEFFPEKEFIKRVNDLYTTEGIGVRDASARVRSELQAQGYAGLKANSGKSKDLLDSGEYRVWGDMDGVPNIKQVGGPQGNAFAPGARSMGAGGGRPPRKPPPDSPEAITDAVRGIARQAPPTPPGGPVIPPRGNMRGVLQMPERVPPASPMADQVPPPLPPRPVSNRVPTSNMPNATEMGLMAGTGAAIGGAFLMEKANDPATFGLASFDQLPPDHPLRDPGYRRMILMAQMQPQGQPANAFAQ